MIVQKFNGCIDFFSKYQRGTTFFFTFEIEHFDREAIEPEKEMILKKNSSMIVLG
jgi:hypothetical protein